MTIFTLFSRMKEIGISPEDKVICFGQLLGMCDYLTFPLGTKSDIDIYKNRNLTESNVKNSFIYFRSVRLLGV